MAGAAALLVFGIGTNLQATTRANDCLAAPNASAPRGQHWCKCWYLHAPPMHRAAKASEFHAVSTAAGTPVSGSRADSAPGLRHSRILSVKPQPTSSVSAKSIQRGDPTWVQQENVPQESTLLMRYAAVSSRTGHPFRGVAPSNLPSSSRGQHAARPRLSAPPAIEEPWPAGLRTGALGA